MVELLWKLVLKINARAVFLSTLLLLCVVLVMLLHHGSRQGIGLKTSGHHVNSTVGAVVPRPLGAALPTEAVEDPFTSAFLVAWLDLEASREREREAARARQPVVEQPTPGQATPTSVSPPKKKEPKWVRVMYQGMIARTDGTCVALVSEVDGGSLHTLTAGGVLLGGRVKDITAERVLLVVGANETEQPLRVGVVSRVPKDGS